MLTHIKTTSAAEAADIFGMSAEDFTPSSSFRIYEADNGATVFIEKMANGEYWTICEREEIITASLTEAEQWLARRAAFL